MSHFPIFFLVIYEPKINLKQNKTDAPNFLNSFITDILAYFLRNNWNINVVENSVTFKGIRHFTLTFAHNLDILIVLDGPVVVSFYVPPTTYINPSINLFPPQM